MTELSGKPDTIQYLGSKGYQFRIICDKVYTGTTQGSRKFGMRVELAVIDTHQKDIIPTDKLVD